MTGLRVFIHRLRGLFLKRKLEQELEDEIRSHLDMQIEDNLRRGMSPDEARYEALRKFGGVEQAKENYRDRRSLPLVDATLQDLRYGVRMLLKHKGFTVVAMLSLALGIGVNTAIFSVVDSILLRPLPYPGAERLVRVLEANLKPTHAWEGWTRLGVPLADFREWRSQSQSFEDAALHASGGGYRVSEPNGLKYLIGSRVSLNLFAFLGTQAWLGRTFLPEDEKPESEHVVVLSHVYWVERYKADPHVLGQKLVINDQPHTIVGILPDSFRDYFSYSARKDLERALPLRVFPLDTTQVWLPIKVTHEAATWYGRGGNRHGAYQVLARLKPGVSTQQAQAELSDIAARLAERYPESNENLGAAVYSLHEDVTGSSRRKLLLLVAAFSLVLLIACANVASLLLARGLDRAKELAIRRTLGAGRLRMLRQLLTEYLLLAGLGGTLGLALAVGMVAGIRPLIPADIPRSDAVTLDYRALLFTLGLTVLTTLLFGLLPAWQTAKLNLTEELKEAGRSVTASRRSRRWRHVLVAGQVALTMILLVGAGLLARSFWRFYGAELGYDMRNLVRMRIASPRPFARERYERVRPTDQDAAEWKSYWQPLLESARDLPGIVDAAFTSGYPPEGVNFGTPLRIPGHTPVNPRSGPIINGDIVSEDYFRLLEIKLLQGRYFNTDDRADTAPVIIVNESFARTYFPQQPTIGQTLTLFPGSKFEHPATIVGVVADTRAQLDRPVETHHYRPIAQVPLRGLNLLARTAGQPAESMTALQDVARLFNPNRIIARPVTLDEARARLTIKPRFYLALLGSLALLALLLAATGIYGTLLLAVGQRRHEIGVRRALGAQNQDVLRLVLREGLLLALAGLGLGLLGAWALTRFISGWLADVSATDPATFIIVTVLLGVIVLLACYAPARRAVRVDPLVALRHE